MRQIEWRAVMTTEGCRVCRQDILLNIKALGTKLLEVQVWIWLVPFDLI